MKKLVVFSHLRWDGVYERPQHLLSRLSRRWEVIFIEEPVTQAHGNELEVLDAAPGVQVWRPHVTGSAPGFHDDHLSVLRQMLADGMCEHGVEDFWLWYCTPMAQPLGSQLKPRGIIYDCMDELSAFTNAPRELVQRENALFKVADLVLTSGRSLYNAKKCRHPEVHCVPNSVDAAHFTGAIGEHPLNAEVPGPRLGYHGLIDERINLVLLDEIAKARPEWNIVLEGPVVAGAAELPRRDNIHWLGPRSHDELPALIAGWDICLLPFALSDATRHMSPAQTLEFMASGKPVVSTSIRDVVEPYGCVVRVADTPQGFIADCEMLMHRTREERAEHESEMAQVVARTSWDGTVQAIAVLIEQADELVGDAMPTSARRAPASGRPQIPALPATARGAFA